MRATVLARSVCGVVATTLHLPAAGPPACVSVPPAPRPCDVHVCLLAESGSDRSTRTRLPRLPRLRDWRGGLRLFSQLLGPFFGGGVCHAMFCCCGCAPLLMILLQVSGDACSRYGAADEPRQPAAVQVVQQPRFIYPCAVVR